MPDPPQHAPSGEPVDIEAIRRKHWREVEPYDQCHWCDGAWPCHTAVVLADLAQRIAELAQVWQQRDQYLEQRNQARREVARLNREIATFDRTAAVPHDHVRIEGCYRCVWPGGVSSQRM